MEINYLNEKYEVEANVFNNKSKKVDIILPLWNNVDLANYALKSLRKFTDNDLYNLWIVDNGSTNPAMLQYINSVLLNLKFDKTTNFNILKHISAPKTWGGSENHALALNLAIPFLTSEYAFLMHDDSVPLASHWLQYLLSKADEGNVCVGTYTNWEKDNKKFVHCSGVLVKRDFIIDNQINFKPNKPQYDTIGMLTLKLYEKNAKTFICRNSRNEVDLRQYHAYDHKYGSESFDDSLKPIWAHEGRGSSSGDRGGWIRTI